MEEAHLASNALQGLVRPELVNRPFLVRRVYHPQPQYLLEAVEVAIPVQQFVPAQQTKSGDQAVDRLMHGVASAKVAVILRGGNGQFAAARLKNMELHQPPNWNKTPQDNCQPQCGRQCSTGIRAPELNLTSLLRNLHCILVLRCTVK